MFVPCDRCVWKGRECVRTVNRRPVVLASDPPVRSYGHYAESISLTLRFCEQRLALETHFGKKCVSFNHLGGLMVIYASASFVHSVHLDAQLRRLCGPVRFCLEVRSVTHLAVELGVDGASVSNRVNLTVGPSTVTSPSRSSWRLWFPTVRVLVRRTDDNCAFLGPSMIS